MKQQATATRAVGFNNEREEALYKYRPRALSEGVKAKGIWRCSRTRP